MEQSDKNIIDELLIEEPEIYKTIEEQLKEEEIVSDRNLVS